MEKVVNLFSCKRSTDFEYFLKSRAQIFEEKAKSRTYLLLDRDKLPQEIDIFAYFSLAMQVLFIPPNMPIRQIKRLDGFSGKIHGERIKALPVVLIGQLARNDIYSTTDITGQQILDYAFSVIRKSYNAIGGRLVMVDVKTEAKGLINFYQENGFDIISNDEATGLSQMIYMLGN